MHVHVHVHVYVQVHAQAHAHVACFMCMRMRVFKPMGMWHVHVFMTHTGSSTCGIWHVHGAIGTWKAACRHGMRVWGSVAGTRGSHRLCGRQGSLASHQPAETHVSTREVITGSESDVKLPEGMSTATRHGALCMCICMGVCMCIGSAPRDSYLRGVRVRSGVGHT